MLCAASHNPFLPLSPLGWWVLSQFRRAGSCQTCGTHICNHLTDFHDSKFCGIVYACSCALLWSFAHLTHMGMPMGQKRVKCGTNWVQTLRNSYLWKCVMDLAHLKFYGLVLTCNRLVSQMWLPLVACREPAEKLWQLYKVLYVFIPPPNEVGGGVGYTGYTLSVRPSVRLSVNDMVSGA